MYVVNLTRRSSHGDLTQVGGVFEKLDDALALARSIKGIDYRGCDYGAFVWECPVNQNEAPKLAFARRGDRLMNDWIEEFYENGELSRSATIHIPEHVCGLQGFGMEISDRCEACETERGNRTHTPSAAHTCNGMGWPSPLSSSCEGCRFERESQEVAESL